MKKKSQQWRTGQIINMGKQGTLKVMAFKDGYYMLRRPGCYPFVKSENELGAFVEMLNRPPMSYIIIDTPTATT